MGYFSVRWGAVSKMSFWLQYTIVRIIWIRIRVNWFSIVFVMLNVQVLLPENWLNLMWEKVQFMIRLRISLMDLLPFSLNIVILSLIFIVIMYAEDCHLWFGCIFQWWYCETEYCHLLPGLCRVVAMSLQFVSCKLWRFHLYPCEPISAFPAELQFVWQFVCELFVVW